MDKPQLIASDVDGTLLTPQELMSPRTVGVVTRVKDIGVPFVLVSGRPARWIPPIAEQAELHGYAVCANGAVVYDIGADAVVSVSGLEPATLRAVADAVLTELPRAHVAAERVAAGAYDDAVPQFVSEHDFRNPWGDGDVHRVSRDEVLGRQVTKLLVSDLTMTSDEMAEAARGVLDGAVDVTFSTRKGLIEIAAHGVTKASGLSVVADMAGVAVDDVIAFGDMPNDIEMLRWAGHGVAMANAHPSVLEIADEITGSNVEDGLAVVLERWF